MFGEVFDTSRPFTSQYTTRNKMQAVLDFPFQDAARNFASKGQADRSSSRRCSSMTTGTPTRTPTSTSCRPSSVTTTWGGSDTSSTADNAGAPEDELLARDRLAHELMYFSRGNPVIYYGDEQGFTGTGGDQFARQSMFASQVPEYLDDDLLGTAADPCAGQLQPRSSAVHQDRRIWLELATDHPALRDGAHQHRYASDGPGIYAFSRIDHGQQREYVVALNNSEGEQTAKIPTYVRNGGLRTGLRHWTAILTSDGAGSLSLTMPALSTVVYESAERMPRSEGGAVGSRLEDARRCGGGELADAGLGRRRGLLVQRGDFLRQGRQWEVEVHRHR